MKKTEEDLQLLVFRLETMIDSFPFDVWLKDKDGKYLVVNKSFSDSAGKTKAEIVGKDDHDVYSKEYAEFYVKTDQELINGSTAEYFESNFKGDILHEYKKPVYDESGELIGIAGFSKNMTEFSQTREALEESERSKAVFLSNLPGVAYRSKNDEKLTMTFISKGCYSLTGYTAEELTDMNPSYYDLIDPEYHDLLFAKWKKNLTLNKISVDEYPITTASGARKWVREQSQEIYDASEHLIATEGLIIDITEKKMAEEATLYLSYHDQLTGLYNRRFYEEELQRLDTERNLPITLVMADVNGLKLTNDAFGHPAGDQLLVKIADIIKKECRADDIVARTGGDEFIILLPKTDAAAAEKMVGRINLALTKARTNYSVCSASFGWATKYDPAVDINGIHIAAEDSMYKKKLSESTSMKTETLKLISRTLYGKNKREQRHCQRVGELCMAIGQALKMSPDDLNEIKTAGLLHDIGMIGIDEKLLGRHGELTETELKEFKRHPEIGYQILRSVNEFAPIAEHILYHHERIDGKGYPRGLRGDDIPLQSKIISIADYYDAIADGGNKAKAAFQPVAVEKLREDAGTRFDKEIVDVFIEKVLNKSS